MLTFILVVAATLMIALAFLMLDLREQKKLMNQATYRPTRADRKSR